MENKLSVCLLLWFLCVSNNKTVIKIVTRKTLGNLFLHVLCQKNNCKTRVFHPQTTGQCWNVPQASFLVFRSDLIAARWQIESDNHPALNEQSVFSFAPFLASLSSSPTCMNINFMCLNCQKWTSRRLFSRELPTSLFHCCWLTSWIKLWRNEIVKQAGIERAWKRQ